MCGISGILSFNPKNLSFEKLKLMTDAISHRGPDGEGHWIDETGKVGLGHRRLSIIDLSSSAAQPMHYMNRYTIVYNGEIYNYIELKSILLARGYSFITNSDTEVLLALYDFKKEKCVEDLDAMFAFAIWDSKEQQLFCARDRFGEKPFFYYKDEESFSFASEMKALWASGIKKTPNLRRIFLYLAYQAQDDLKTSNSTFFNEIFQLEPAHYFYLKHNKIINKTKYWDINIEHCDSRINLQEANSKFYDLLSTSIHRRLRSDVPVGSSLSGGLDSSTIVSIIDKTKPTNQIQKTFSACFPGFVKDERKYIDIINRNCKVESHQVNLNSKILYEDLESAFYYQEEPYGSTSILAQWNVMKLAKQNNVTVLLDGQGADEILAGYPTYFYNYFCSLARYNKLELKNQKKKYHELYGNEIKLGNWMLIHSYFPNLRSNLRTIKNYIKKPDYLKQFSSDFFDECKDISFNYQIPTNLKQTLYKSTMKSDLNTLLRHADRNSMAHGREVRMPFLNHKLVEFIFSLPDNYKLHNGWTKFILRESMKDILPYEICWRKEKIGFEPPNYKSIDTDVAETAKTVLIDNKIINKANYLKKNDWLYYQVSKLFDK